MAYFLAADGGGSKLIAVLYDTEWKHIRVARTAGTNTAFKSEEQVVGEMNRMLDDLIPSGIDSIEAVDQCIAGIPGVFPELVAKRVPVGYVTNRREEATILGAAGYAYGVVAQAGTGSDAFLLQPDVHDFVGGWGGLLGDEGSGYDIGLQTIKSAIRSYDGRGKKTVLEAMLREEWGLQEMRQVIDRVISEPDDHRLIASVTKLTARAAAEGDEVALGLYRRAGMDLAEQVQTLLLRHHNVWQGPIVACGGAWKGNALMFRTFRDILQKQYPAAEIRLPEYEPVVGCIWTRLHDMGFADDAIAKQLQEHFADLRYPAPKQ